MNCTLSSRSNHSGSERRYFAGIAMAVVLSASILIRYSAEVQTETVLYSFKGAPADAGYPSSGVILDASADIYGTSRQGGPVNVGTVFGISKHGEKVLRNFSGVDGEIPLAGLLRDATGNLYGTTTGGGTAGWGTVFKISASGKWFLLHSFAGPPTDGGYPLSGLILDAKGNLSGTTELGGAKKVGTVFRLDPTGKESVVHSFTGGALGEADGANPRGGLLLDGASNLYGTTMGGGAQNAGTVFKIDSSENETVVYAFTGEPDGEYPMGSLVRDSAGNLYGITNVGGSANFGTIFKVDTTGKETVLHSFGSPGDCSSPQWGVISDAGGNLLGTAQGGTLGYGAVFSFDPATSKEKILHFFSGGASDGQYPMGTLAIDSHGDIYGATQQGGASNWGTVFKIWAGR